jgi:hypothetical protein
MVLRARPGRVARSLVYETFAFAFLACIPLLLLPAVMAQGRRKKPTHWCTGEEEEDCHSLSFMFMISYWFVTS